MFSNKCLAVEISGEEIRACLVKKTGKKIEIADFTALQRVNPGDDLPDIELLKEVKLRLGYNGKNAVFTGPVAREIEISMNREKVHGLGNFQLKESVKWEVEPFTGINGAMALTGVKVPEYKPKIGEIIEESDEINVYVSVIEQNIYRALKERFKAAGLSLSRVYPPESCFFEVIRQSHDEADRAVFEISDDRSNFALISGGEIKFINSLNITTDLIKDHILGRLSPDLEDTINFLFSQAPKPYPVALTGTGALDDEIIGFLNSVSQTKSEPLRLKRSAGLTEAGFEESPLFATAAGAGYLELCGGKNRNSGIDDLIPVFVQIRRSAYLMPLLVTVLLFLSLFVHNRYMIITEKKYSKNIEEFKQDLKESAAKNEALEKLKKKLESIESEKSGKQKRKKFLETEADENISSLINNLEAISKSVPYTSTLVSIESKLIENKQKIYIKGISSIASNAYSLSGEINKNFNLESNVLSIKKQSEKSGFPRYLFEIEVVL
ncbi:MAG: hypothetical protein RBR08_00630 [Desulforegulaceae bacterium]|nr:hypothetical protein [Desulforegulaceae bacterium]